MSVVLIKNDDDISTYGFVADVVPTVGTPFRTLEMLPASHTRDSDHAECGGVIIPTPLVDFSGRSLYRVHIAFLWGATAISKINIRFFISCTIGLKFCTRLEGDNANKTGFRICEFPALKNLAPL